MSDMWSTGEAGPRKTLVYGESFVGKSHFCSMHDKSVVIATQDGTKDIPHAKTWNEICDSTSKLISALDYFKNTDTGMKFLTIDMISDVFLIRSKEVVKETASKIKTEKYKPKDLLDIGQGKGYAKVASFVSMQILDRLEDIRRDRGIHIFLTAHDKNSRNKDVEAEKEKQQNTPNMPASTLNLIRGWVDEIFYVKFEVDKKETKFSEHVKYTGRRIAYTLPKGEYLAKNRMPGLPESFEFEWSVYEKYLRDYFLAGKDKKNG